MPRERERDYTIAGHSADDPDDHDGLELLEVDELRDEMDGSRGADASDYSRKVSVLRGKAQVKVTPRTHGAECCYNNEGDSPRV